MTLPEKGICLSPNRLTSIDFTRGLVIVIMALDHIRDLLHNGTGDPTDLNTTTPALFMTRWITHFCAPIFVFLAGTSAYLMCKKQNDPSKTGRFLVSRGLWLIFLEISVIGFGFWADIQFRTILFQVIFAIGAGFIILSGLIRLPGKIIGLLGLAIILLHDALPAKPFTSPAGEFIWSLLFQRGFFKFGTDRALIIGYAVIPWLGIMLAGYGYGKVFELPSEKRRKLLLMSGIGALTLFVMLRLLNLYGDPKPWVTQPSQVFSFFSFLNVSKYPPSLMYTAMTLCVMFFLLRLADARDNALIRTFVTYGQVPMFFYILHWYIVHASMFVIILLQGVTWDQMVFGVMHFGKPEGSGVALPFVYLYWLCLVIGLYPLCRWYGRYKAAHRQNKWLSYL